MTVYRMERDDTDRALRLAWGQAIRSTRTFRGWTIDRLAAEMGGVVTPQAISRWERGEAAPRWNHQLQVARALGVPHGLLFSITATAA